MSRGLIFGDVLKSCSKGFDECWNWPTLDGKGYGRFGGAKNKDLHIDYPINSTLENSTITYMYVTNAIILLA